MAQSPHIFLRGTIWTWRRRMPPLSTEISHLQLSLRTQDRAVARILASRLTYESDRMFEALSLGALSPKDCKTWLESVIRTELARITRMRTIARLDPITGGDEIDRRLDWATVQAWRIFAERGLEAEIDAREETALRGAGAGDREIGSLESLIVQFRKEITVPSGVAKMLAAARSALGGDESSTGALRDTPSALTVLQLRQFLIAGKAAAWKAAEGMRDPHLDWAYDYARSLVENPQLPAVFSEKPSGSASNTDVAAIAPPPLAARSLAPVQAFAPAPVVSAPREIDYDPDLMALVDRINADKSREHIKPETRKQLVSGVKLFILAIGITRITDIEQKHLKAFKDMLQRLPRHYGKSPKDANRSIDEILARADDLPEDEVGLSPRTINGHLERWSLMVRYAKSEGIAVSPSIQLDLLRVQEIKRDRDKRPPFTLEEVVKVFRHTIWTGCRNHTRRHLPGNMILRDGLYWGPLLSAYSGARREEVLGLMLEDICEIDGIPCYHIRDNMHRSVKTFASERLIPIHPHLIELGFLRHVAAQRKAGANAIFPELKPTNDTESFGDKIFYNWDRALDIQLEGNPKGLCFHSFRHYVIDFLKCDKTVTDKERRDLVGHVGKDAHDETYDMPTSMLAMLQIVTRLPRVF
ncbi:site-specific integrase [Rhodobacter capsulatus]|uniref:Site-specific integrase n=1 Tax=Rhodobacter capsulatus TaxID=1061 RepID=A0A4U1JLC0_RHOCA|nr:site-specific integrase [Rhodobacter capsulatus]TKD13791.1 site-specific integrase [Rhodobacter capsulatus]